MNTDRNDSENDDDGTFSDVSCVPQTEPSEDETGKLTTGTRFLLGGLSYWFV